jgi:hypothetical protein
LNRLRYYLWRNNSWFENTQGQTHLGNGLSFKSALSNGGWTVDNRMPIDDVYSLSFSRLADELAGVQYVDNVCHKLYLVFSGSEEQLSAL